MATKVDKATALDRAAQWRKAIMAASEDWTNDGHVLEKLIAAAATDLGLEWEILAVLLDIAPEHL